ncbi:hypothetical protein MLC59_09545 [Marinobacter bryozoorum]|uniref:hypothetical protein n=1 Tax=Marinobacter bryozoorum TaxID=256324 RepID=UPI0020054C26|nr:hypothetical protein [Marinobacter bryozoorum]MCK7544410.1 hypothetical protein [Marinobacter bryozoorum]
MLVAKDRGLSPAGATQLTRRSNSRPTAAGRPFHCGCASITRAPLCAGVMQIEKSMNRKFRIHELFDAMAEELLLFIRESENEFSDGWVPATFIKEQLELKKSAYPKGNRIDNKTGWLFSTLARHLEDKSAIAFKKSGSRTFYKSI